MFVFNQLYGLKVQHAGPRTLSMEITSFPLPLNITTHAKTIDLTHCGLVRPYGDRDQLTGLGNGLLLDGTEPLPEPMMTDH